MVKQLGLHLQNINQPYEVSLPNGHKAKVSQQAQNLPYTIQNHHSKVNLHVVPLELNTIIFGNQWLADINSIINWKTKEFTINQNGHTQTITTDPKVERVSAKEFAMILEDTREDPQVFAVTLDEDDKHTQEFYDKHRQQVTDPELDNLLQEYDDIFKEKLPKAAPTKRTIVHHIPL